MAPSGNTERMRRIIQDFNDGGVERVIPYCDEEIECYDPDRPAGGVYAGHDGVRRFLSELVEGLEAVQARAEDLVSAGDRVVGLIHAWGRGPDGMEIEIRDAHAFTFRDGLVTYWRSYTNREEALGDVGLAPAAPGSD